MGNRARPVRPGACANAVGGQGLQIRPCPPSRRSSRIGSSTGTSRSGNVFDDRFNPQTSWIFPAISWPRISMRIFLAALEQKHPIPAGNPSSRQR